MEKEEKEDRVPQTAKKYHEEHFADDYIKWDQTHTHEDTITHVGIKACILSVGIK